MRYSFCETVHAMITPRWHIRKLESGEKQLFGGGLKARIICHLPLSNSWNINVDFEKLYEKGLPQYMCRVCVKVLNE